MTSAEAFAIARAKLQTVDVNPLWGHEKQTAEMRKDIGAILDALERNLNSEPDYLQPLEDYEYDDRTN